MNSYTFFNSMRFIKHLCLQPLFNQSFFTKYKKGLVLGSVICMSSAQYAVASDWQPIVSDKLLKLPANVISQRIESDFSASPLVTELNRIEQSLTQSAQQIKQLQQLHSQANEQDSLALSIDIVDKKSLYVSLLKQSHELRSTLLTQRQASYENVLQALNAKKEKQNSVSTHQVQQARLAAKTRASKSQQKVQLLLSQYEQQAKQPQEYTHYQQNLEKIAQLKQAFNDHVMNSRPEVSGVEVSDQEYVRELLVRLSTERELLEQENTMLSYMTKLVALDAQNLTTQLNENSAGANHNSSSRYSSNNYQLASQATDLFIDGEAHE